MKRRLATPSSHRLLAICVAVVASLPANAHDFDDRYGTFLGSFLHPLTALDHGLAFLVVGLWAGQHGGPVTWRGIAAFVAGLLFGSSLPWILSLSDGSIAHLTTVNIISVVLLGLLVALGRSVPILLFIVGGLAGFSHGLENSIDRAVNARSLFSVAGVVASGAFAASLLGAIATKAGAGWQRITVQILGSWIAAIGLMMLGFHLR